MARKMTLADKQRVIELEKRERFILSEIIFHLNLKSKYNYTGYLSTIDTDCPYDAIITIKDFDGNILETFIVELKNRTHDWSEDGFIFEKKKYNALLKAKKSVELELSRKCTLMYWCVTNKNTYLFNLEDIELGKSKRKAMNKETFAEEKQEVNKNVYLLNSNSAIIFNYRYNEQNYLNSLKPKAEIKLPISHVEKNTTYSIF